MEKEPRPQEVSDFEDTHSDELPAFIKKYGTRILVLVAIFMIGISALQLIKYNIQQSQQQKKDRLTSLMVEQKIMSTEAVNQDPDKADAPVAKPYVTEELVANLSKLAKQASGSEIGKMALLQQAEAIRTEIVFGATVYTPEQKLEICRKAGDLYSTLLKTYDKDAAIVGPAMISQGLLAEEMGQWDQAAQTYQQIIEKEKTLLAGTVFPQQARVRLAKMDKIKENVDFVDAPKPVIPPVDAQPAAAPVGPAAAPAIEIQPAPATPAVTTTPAAAPAVETPAAPVQPEPAPVVVPIPAPAEPQTK